MFDLAARLLSSFAQYRAHRRLLNRLSGEAMTIAMQME